jgi:hypothetical protein
MCYKDGSGNYTEKYLYIQRKGNYYVPGEVRGINISHMGSRNIYTSELDIASSWYIQKGLILVSIAGASGDTATLKVKNSNNTAYGMGTADPYLTTLIISDGSNAWVETPLNNSGNMIVFQMELGGE